MVRLMISIEDDIVEKLAAAAKAKHVSKSSWVANLIKEKLAGEWPESISRLAGAWNDLPLADEGRAGLGPDIGREAL